MKSRRRLCFDGSSNDYTRVYCNDKSCSLSWPYRHAFRKDLGMENPYKAPLERLGQPSAAADSANQSQAISPSHPTRFLGGRLSIIFVAVVFGTVSVFSLVGFVFNLMSNYPGTDRPVIVVDPLWMLGHVIRGIGLGMLTYFLFRYRSAIKKCCDLGGEDVERLIATHDTLWKTGALVLGVLVVYALVYVAYTASLPRHGW